ncbi:6,7-dimethyl-8-ribityllumazine synthase [Lactococcus lactis]|nr:6,7-dimethyl-8-ribityllumazine synthase [Lactococcus lactis]
MATSNKYEAIICLGTVIRGSTSHYDFVCNEVSKGIAHVSLNSNIPVMFGVLTTEIVEASPLSVQAAQEAGNRKGLK